MEEKKLETFVYEDFGFPVYLIDVPLRKVFGEWVLDIDLNKLQEQVLKRLIQQPTPLSSSELRFIRKYFEMTTAAFGEVFGVTHAAVLKWERGLLPSPPMDMYIRMYIMERLHAKDAEFGKLFHKIHVADLAKAKKHRIVAKPLAMHFRRSRQKL